MNSFEKDLNNHLNELLMFARSKMDDNELAADVVQDSLLKALKAQDTLRENYHIRAWLFSILRNTITDLYRKKANHSIITSESENLPNHDYLDQLVCTCIEKLIPTLNDDYAILVRELELNQRPSSKIAKQLNISPNNLKVKRHRARQQLKHRLEETCQLCAKHGCLDCDCDQS